MFQSMQVRRAADAALDAAMDADEHWALTIRNLKFESHNEAWLAVVQTSGDDLGATLQRPGTGTGTTRWVILVPLVQPVSC